MEPIPYARQSVSPEDIDAVAQVLRSDWLTTGPAVAEFERKLAIRAGGVPVVALSSGTAALHAAYASVGLGPGRELLTTPLTFAATATAALHLGAKVRFADVDETTLTIDPLAAEAEMGPDTAVIAPVDYAGHPADMDSLRTVADNHGAILVEDAAHSIGTLYKGRAVGSLADLTTFSFHAVKTVTTGEGGAVSTRQEELLRRLRRFRDHGMVRAGDEVVDKSQGAWHQEVQSLGLNYRMPDILAALGSSQLDRLDDFIAKRSRLVGRYHDLLAGVQGLELPVCRPEVTPAWHLFAVRILEGRRREVFDRLRENRIGAQVHYLPLYRHPLFEELGFRPGMCPIAERAYEELLSLPLFPDLTDAQQDRVTDELRAALGE